VLVVLTARTDEMDVVVGLEAGVDDYLTEPFRFGELLARIRAHLRRQAVLPPGPGPAHRHARGGGRRPGDHAVRPAGLRRQ
jgi:DNA-binding response OmpR family regulator